MLCSFSLTLQYIAIGVVHEDHIRKGEKKNYRLNTINTYPKVSKTQHFSIWKFLGERHYHEISSLIFPL